MSGPRVQALVDAWAVLGRRLDVPGAATSVWEEGEGEPVLCVHGVPVSAYLYRKVLPELARNGMRGIALDLPGLGLAQRPRDFDYGWTALSGWLERAVDALGLERFHLVVHDVGGPVGFDLVRRVPERVASLTVLNTWVRSASFSPPWTMAPFRRRGLGKLWLRGTLPPAFVALLRLQGVKTAVPARELLVHRALVLRGDGGAAFLKIMRSFELTEEFEARTLATLRARSFPAQIAWGVHDPVLRVDGHGEQVREALGVDEITRLDAKHFVQEDRPAEIARLVAQLASSAPV